MAALNGVLPQGKSAVLHPTRERTAPLPARRAAPDCIWDDIFEHRPWFYRIRGEINSELRPAGLLAIHSAKIDGDLALLD